MEPLKNMYNPAFIQEVISAIKKHQSDFDGTKFTALIFDKTWDDLELKERMRHIALTLHKTLKGNYPQQLEVLNKVAPELAAYKFEQIFLPDFVQVFGLEDEKYQAISIAALKHLTRFSSSEFAVRPFLVKYPELMLKTLLAWAKDDNFHVRRLASEGCRPRLPWAMALPKFKKDPTPILPILELLKADETDYVRRSVANNLNDIAKDHPDVVLKTVKRWYGDNKNTNWIVRHACRTLLKQGNTEALMLFGFGNPAAIKITNLKITPTNIKIGDSATFQFQVKNTGSAAKLRVEYGIYYMKKNGKQSKKIFQLSEKEFAGHQSITIQKKQHFKNLTTRKHYVGTHRIGIVVNGVEKAVLDFELED